MPRLSSIVVVPARGATSGHRGRYAKITPWHRLPGRVYLSDSQNTHVKRAARNVLMILEEKHAELHRENFQHLNKGMRDIQTSCFVDIQSKFGPRREPATEDQRYRLKAFFGPILDALQEMAAGCDRLSPAATEDKVRVLTRLVRRLYSLQHPTLKE